MHENGIRFHGSVNVYDYMETLKRAKARVEAIEEWEAVAWLAKAKDEVERAKVKELYAQAFERLAKLGESD